MIINQLIKLGLRILKRDKREIKKLEPLQPKMILFYYGSLLPNHIDKLANTCQQPQSTHWSTSLSQSLSVN